MRMENLIEPQLKAFVNGFQTALPCEFITFMRTNDLYSFIAGESEINVEEMKATIVTSNKDSDLIKWMFEILAEYTQDQLSSFLQYVTGKVFGTILM